MTRLLMIADGAWPTGFERVARNIGTHLHNSGQFTVIHRGLGYDGSTNHTTEYPYEIRSSGQTPGDPLGTLQLTRWLKEDQPDVVLMIQDIWNVTNYLGFMPRDLPTVGYYPIDAPNLKWAYGLGVAALTDAIPYTTFGAKESVLSVRDASSLVIDGHARSGQDLDAPALGLSLPKNGMDLYVRTDRLAARQHMSGYDPIPHGVEHDRFQILDKRACRRAFGIPEDAYVVLNVNTNQFRKRQDLTIRAFARIKDEIPNAMLVMHCMGGFDREGWDLGQLARLYGIEDRLICVHWICPNLSDEQLVQLYNTADVQINTGGGEGWGLTSVEGALCGVPQLVPDWSATREIWKDFGLLLPVSDYRFEPKYLNTAHAIIDTKQAANRLVYLAKNPDARAGVAAQCHERALALPTWSTVAERFATRLTNAAHHTPPATPISLRKLHDQIREPMESELVQRDSY